MQSEEFDLDALNRLIDDALEDKVPPGQPKKHSIPFSFNDSRLLELLAEILPKYLHQADTQAILDQLRTELYQGVDLGKLQAMHAVIKHCRKCPEVTPSPTQPRWNLSDPDVVFIVDHPQMQSEESKFLVENMTQAGFSSKNICLTYAIRCPVLRRVPTQSELDNCSGYLYTELQMLQPKLIVPLGNAATSMFIGQCKITEVHGKVFWIGPWAIMPMLGPGYVLKAKVEGKFEEDINNAYRFVYGGK